MRTVKYFSMLLCVAAVMFNSCKKDMPPHLKAIPGDAFFVVAFENRQMVKKGELKHLKDYRIFRKMMEDMNYGSPEAQKMMTAFIENPKSSGLDMDQSYLFGVKQDDGFYVAKVFRMDNIENFESSAKELMRIQDDEPVDMEDRGAYKIMSDGDRFALAWNREVLFIVFSGNVDAINFDGLFAVPQEKSIVNVDDFNDFNKRSYDIGFWMPYGAIMDFYKSFLNTDLSAVYKGLSEAFVHGYLNFENGEVKLSGLMTPKSKVEEYLAQYPILKKDFDQDLLRAFPEKSYLAFKLSINVLEYVKMIRDVSEQMDADLPIDQLMLGNPAANTVINALGGDMLLSLYGFAQGPLPMPLAGIAFTVKSRDDFDRLLALVPEGTVKQSGEHYVVSTGMMVSFYIAYKDNMVYVTDDADAVASFTGKGFGKHLANGPLGGEMKKSPYLFYINLDMDSYPENIRNMLQREMGSIAAQSLTFLKPYRDFSISVTGDYEGIVSLKLKDGSRNSLKQLLENWDEIAAATMP